MHSRSPDGTKLALLVISVTAQQDPRIVWRVVLANEKLGPKMFSKSGNFISEMAKMKWKAQYETDND